MACSSSVIVGAMGEGSLAGVDPIVAGERIAELLELPDGCNALLVDGAHGLFRRDGLCDICAASAELPSPAALADKCGDLCPHKHKNNGRATDFLELNKLRTETFALCLRSS